MKPDDNRHLEQLGRRERQIMDVIYRKGRATVAEIRAELPDPPTYSAVRGMLRFLEDKGYLRHAAEGPRYVYGPTADPKQVRGTAVRHLVRTFFNDSASSAVAAMLGLYKTHLSEDDLDRLEALIDQTRKANSRGGKTGATS
jgi:BlaI family transcriptional regulator, penicillinase repressor